jgi:DNA helicase HerA-like ATPase
LSPHNTIAAGDAENDLALLHAAEVGAAVANAVPSLAAHADLRLGSRDGAGVAELLAGPLLAGRQRLCPRRRWLPIGTYDDDGPVLVPGSQGSVLIAGDTGGGKSYLAGLLAERWIDAGYAVLVIDPEGDHVGLAQRPGVHLVDAAAHLPSPADLLAAARPGQVIIGDKNYYGRDFEVALAAAGLTLLRPARKGEPPRPGTQFFKPLRQIIESVNDTFKGQLDLEQHGGHTVQGVTARVLQKILALTAAIWHNDATSQPVMRSLLAYDH